jgi:hypothetical protein
MRMVTCEIHTRIVAFSSVSFPLAFPLRFCVDPAPERQRARDQGPGRGVTAFLTEDVGPLGVWRYLRQVQHSTS